MTMKNYPRLFHFPKTSFFLLGMRGVGKSTLVKSHFKNAKVINLLDEGLYQLYLSKPEAFAEDLSLVKAGSWVIVDEVQRLPQLLNEVHRFIVAEQLLEVDCENATIVLEPEAKNTAPAIALAALIQNHDSI